VRLTQLELDLIYYFSQHPGRVLTREELLERVWKLRNAPIRAASTISSCDCASISSPARQARASSPTGAPATGFYLTATANLM
jgi:hypothetical protein